jgi:hypothetical protein
MKFQTRPADRSSLGPDIDIPEQVVGFGTGTIRELPAVPPVAFTHQLVVVPRPNEVLLPYRLRILLSLVRNALADEELAPCRLGRRVNRPLAERKQVAGLGAVVPVQGLSDLRGRCQQGPACPANEGARIADERRRQHTAGSD